MTSALSPALALDYLRELSADFRAGIVLDAAGARLAGADALLAPAREILAADPGATAIEGRIAAGHAYAARDDRHAIVIATGRFALPRVTRHDLRTVLAALAGEPDPGAQGTEEAPPSRVPGAASEGAVRALLAAAEDGFWRHSAI